MIERGPRSTKESTLKVVATIEIKGPPTEKEMEKVALTLKEELERLWGRDKFAEEERIVHLGRKEFHRSLFFWKEPGGSHPPSSQSGIGFVFSVAMAKGGARAYFSIKGGDNLTEIDSIGLNFSSYSGAKLRNGWTISDVSDEGRVVIQREGEEAVRLRMSGGSLKLEKDRDSLDIVITKEGEVKVE